MEMENRKPHFFKQNVFKCSYRTKWPELQNEGNFCDVTLVCDDKQFQAHQIVVASSSQVLRYILKENSTQHPLIYLGGVEQKHLENLLTYIYEGEVNVVNEDLDSFLKLAVDLKIKGLSGENRGEIVVLKQYSSSKRKYFQENISDLKKTNGQVNNFSSSEINKDIVNQTLVENNLKSSIPHVEQILTRPLPELKDDNCSQTISLVAGQEKEPIVERHEKDINNVHSLLPLTGRKIFFCDKCEKQFVTEQGFQKHAKINHEAAQYSCDQCDFKPKRREGLKRHVDSVHKGIRYPCDICNNKSADKSRLLTHIKKHHGKT